MPLPSSLLSYKAEMDFFEIAMDSPTGGARMYHRERPQAEHFRNRCNYARVLHRQDNKLTHEPGTPLHGRSEYDVLTFTIRVSDDGYWVYAKKSELDTSRVENIPEEEADVTIIETAEEVDGDTSTG